MDTGMNMVNKKRIVLLVCICSFIILSIVGVVTFFIPKPEISTQNLTTLHISSKVNSKLLIKQNQSINNSIMYCNEYQIPFNQISINVSFNIEVVNRYDENKGIHIQTSIIAYYNKTYIDIVNVTNVIHPFNNITNFTYNQMINFSDFNEELFKPYVNNIERKILFVLYTSIVTYKGDNKQSISENTNEFNLTLRNINSLSVVQFVGIGSGGVIGLSIITLLIINRQNKRDKPEYFYNKLNNREYLV